MKIARIQGTVTLNRCLPEFLGARLKLAAALDLDELLADAEPAGETVVAWDQLGAGIGQQVAISDGREAAQPFQPQIKPVDVYVAAILDQVVVEPLQDTDR